MRDDIDRLRQMTSDRRGSKPIFIFLEELPDAALLDDTVYSPFTNRSHPPTASTPQEGRLSYPDAIDIGPIKHKKGES